MEDFCGDVLNNCMQLLINLTNTNFLPTHLELCRAFANQNNSLSLLFEHVEVNPSCSIFNAQLMTLVLHIFYSSTGPYATAADRFHHQGNSKNTGFQKKSN